MGPSKGLLGPGVGYCRGDNLEGTLGNGTTEVSVVPVSEIALP